MPLRTSPVSRSDTVFATFLLTGGLAATLLIWRPGQWEGLAAKSVLLLLCATLAAARPEQCALRETQTPLRVAAAALILLPILGVLQSIASISAVPHLSTLSSLDWAACVAVFLTASILAVRSNTRHALLTATAIVGSALCLLATLQFFTSNGRIFWIWPAAEPQVFGPFHSRNNYASFALLLFPLVAWKGLHSRLRWHYIAAAALIGASIVASGSRAGAALFALEALILFAHFRLATSTKGTLAAAAMLCAAIGIFGWTHLQNKLSDEDPLRYRREMIGSAIDMFRQRPASGFGLGVFPAAYPAFAKFDSGHYVNHAHNDWAELAAEGGIPALACLGIFLATMLPAALRSIWGLGVPTVFAHSLVDYPLQRLGVSFWLFLIAALLLSGHRSDSPDKHPWTQVRKGFVR